jgi:hypothetical protein
MPAPAVYSRPENDLIPFMEDEKSTYRPDDGLGTEIHLRWRSGQDEAKRHFLVLQWQDVDSKDEVYQDGTWSLMGVPEDGLGTSELADLFGERIDNKEGLPGWWSKELKQSVRVARRRWLKKVILHLLIGSSENGSLLLPAAWYPCL